MHIVSLNPENIITLLHDKTFEKVVAKAHYVIADGIGTVAAVYILYGIMIDRTTGVDVMDRVLTASDKESLRICLIGGKHKVAERIADCYKSYNPSAKIVYLSNFFDISNFTDADLNEIKSIVASEKPHIVFVAFGSPKQEIWIERHKSIFNHCVVMGVGGAFDFLSGEISRAPRFIRNLGFEWLYRLFRQPWRIKRQYKLIEFVVYVLIYKALIILGLKEKI